MEKLAQITKIHSAFMAKESANWNYAGESHDFWELVYVESGTVGITAAERVFTCEAGTVVLHRPNEFHRIWSAGCKEIAFTVISFSLGEPLRLKLGKVMMATEEMSRLLHQLQSMIIQYRGQNFFCPEMLSGDPLAYSRFATTLELLLYACTEGEEHRSDFTDSGAEIFTAAVQLMQKNLSAPLKTEELAKMLHVSLSQLKAVFNRYTSTGIHKYFLNLKMEKACRLLRQGESVTKVAEAIGMPEGNYFSAVFKRETGMTPTVYRNASKK